MLKRFLKHAERGQAIIIIAFGMVGLIAIVGLMTDTGILLIEYAKLKRGIDSAAIASALQFRKGFTGADLSTAAEEFLTLNQSTPDNIIVYRCKDTGVVDGTEHDATLCTTPLRKLIRIEASRTVTFGFLRVIGINSTTIQATSVGEAASIDLVLVIDTSASMAYETGNEYNTTTGALVDCDTVTGTNNTCNSPDADDDPSVCNFSAGTPCEPLNTVKEVAEEFLDTIFFPYDRVAIVAMTSQTPGGTRDHVTVLSLEDTEADVLTAIGNLNVYQPPTCSFGPPAAPSSGPCLNYNTSGAFIGLECPLYRNGPDLIPNTGDEVFDISSCNSSNIGGALLRAASEFAVDPIREDSFWVTILLAGGPANATDSAPGYNYGYCPSYTWVSATHPFCRDADADTRHGDGDADYDADDYARDMADYLADPVDGQGVTVFTIGLGRLIQNAPKGDPDAGEQLLTYIAETAGGVTANHGEYFYSPDSAGLDDIFLQIADNIFTRISQ